MGNGRNKRYGKARPPHERRPLPAEQTGDEARHLDRLKDARTPLVVVLASGEQIEGVVEYFDREKIKITRKDGPNLFLRKSEIRMLREGA